MITVLIYLTLAILLVILEIFEALEELTKQNAVEELMTLKLFWSMNGKKDIYHVELVVFDNASNNFSKKTLG